MITAIAFALSPFAVRSLRRLFGLLVLLVALATMYLGAGLPSDLLGGVLLGMTTAAAVLVAFGSPAGKPTVDEVRAALDGPRVRRHRPFTRRRSRFASPR